MSTAAKAETSKPSFDAKPMLILRAAVLGAGTMGSRIAAHLANSGISTLLLDLPPRAGGTERPLAEIALANLAKSKPAALFEPSLARLITPGNFDDD
jgi:3-hydroxyacyl-CoA dehydrogenase